MKRPDENERGAVAVFVALLMVALLGVAAVSIDVGALWAERRQLQNGADAGALAIAQDCARGACGDPTGTANQFAVANNPATATAATPTASVTLAPGSVTVSNATVQDHWFAPVLGIDESGISASATARWGVPTSGTAVLPLTFSWCEWKAQTGGGSPTGTVERTIIFTKDSGTGCTGPSGNAVPGGFGWLPTDTGTCNTTSALAQILSSDTGASIPTGCSSADFQKMVGSKVLLPIFDHATGTGNNATYRVYGYAAFKITGYRFPSVSYNATQCESPSRNCVRGYFVEFVDIASAFTYGTTPGAPDLGAEVVRLTR